jgi:hypothetical protein
MTTYLAAPLPSLTTLARYARRPGGLAPSPTAPPPRLSPGTRGLREFVGGGSYYPILSPTDGPNPGQHITLALYYLPALAAQRTTQERGHG